MPNTLFFFFLLVAPTTFGQIAWTWETLSPMPDSVSNNAVTFGKDDLNDYVFSFGGIDPTKIHSGIHKRAFRYTLATDSWEEIAPLPFSLSNIASSASTVQNKIYIIGGYHVNPGGSEISSNEVIRYDPSTNAYLTNGNPVPIPIDDHVSGVWRDSLIYIVTGWSNTGNVPHVQIYNPALDNWLVGTAVPNTNDFKVFGASGSIIGDTIYYYGGASMGADFPARKQLRKGVINAENPTEINWTLLEDGPNTLYRSAALHYEKTLFWAGGSATSYNYDGIAYNGSGGVEPLTQIMQYNTTSQIWNAGEGAPHGVMDLRGIAQISPTEWIICGGMETEQQVSAQTYRLQYDPIVGATHELKKPLHTIAIHHQKVMLTEPAQSIELIDITGKISLNLPVENPELPNELTGFYILKVVFQDDQMVTKKIVLY